MKAFFIYTLLVVSVLACGTLVYCNSRNAKTAEIRLQTQKKQAEATAAHAKAMEALESKEAAKLRKDTADREFAAKRKDNETQRLKTEEAKSNARKMEESRKTAEAEAKTADANRKKAEADAAAAKDRRLAAEAAAKFAEATNETRHAELEIARETRIKANIDLKAKEAVREAEELKKADYESLLKNVRALEAILREREEATRPAMTLEDLVAENEMEPAEAEGGTSVEDLKDRIEAESNRVTNVVKPKTRGDEAIEAAEARLGRIAAEGSAVVRAKARARLEELARRAASEGRKASAEYYLAQATALFGEDDEKESEDAKDAESEASKTKKPSQSK